MESGLPTTSPPGRDAAPKLAFSVEDGGVLEHAAVPTLRFALRVEEAGGGSVRSVSLNVQVRIAATRRSYDDVEEERLAELFGRREQWDRSLRSVHWTNLAVVVPAFSGSTVVEVPVTCTYDLEVAASKYFDALAGGDVPLEFLFGGTVFYADAEGRLQVRPIAWSEEASFRLPVAAWRDMMDRHFPNTAWLRLRRDAFERLHAYRARNALLTWEDTVDSLLRAGPEGRD
jgi:Family of unknown function (DUF6084)